MTFWWCNQSSGWDSEYPDSVVRSSKRGKSDRGLTFRRTVEEARRGDIVVHYRKPEIVAFSRAREDGHAKSNLPNEYGDGWEFATEYFLLENPIHRNAFHKIIEIPPITGYALNRKANVNQGYFFRFDIAGISLLLNLMVPSEILPTWLSPLRNLDATDPAELEAIYTEPARFRSHQKRERNPKLASEAKRIHGYTCQVCGFNFAERYGERGAGYIEAHHLIPLASLNPEEEVVLSPKDDFAVVCANCHRMLHKKPYPSIQKLRKVIDNE